MPARNAASSASSMRTGARLRERGRAISANSLERSTQSASSPEQRAPSSPLGTLAAMGVRLALETTAARGDRRALARGRPRRRHDASRESCSGSSIRVPSMRSRRGFRAASRSSRRRTGRRRRPRWRRRSSAPTRRLAWNRAGANLLSGIASALVAARRRGSRPVRGRRGRASRGARAHASTGRRARRTSSATSSTATASSRSSPSAGARRSRRSRRRRRSSSTPTIRSSRTSPTGASARFGSASTTRAMRGPALQHAADSKYCVRCGAPYEYAAAYVGHLGDYRCPECGHARPAARRRGARTSSCAGSVASRFRLVTPAGERRRSSSRFPGLYNVYNATAAAALALAVGASLEDVRAGLERFSAAFGRFERIPTGGKSVVLLLIKNPAGANEVRANARDGRSARSRASRSTTRSPTARTSRGSGTSTSSRSSSMSGSSS